MERSVAAALLLVTVYYFLQIHFSSAATVDPGVDIRVTRRGLSYAGQFGASALRNRIVNGTVPNYVKSGFFLKYNISNINVTGVGHLRSSFPRDLSEGLTWVIRNVVFDVTASFSMSFCLLKSHGGIHYTVGNSSLYLPLSIGVDNTGRPTLKSACRFEVDNSILEFTGTHAVFLNWLARTFKGAFQGMIQNMVCSAVTTDINKSAAKYFSRYQANKTLGTLFTVDYSLLSSPSYSTNYMDIPLKGETFWTKKRASSSVPVPELPPFANRSRMVYFYLKDSLFNSLGQVAFRQELLDKTLTYRDLPSDQGYFLNTTCPGNLCLGKLIAQTAQMFPNSRAELHMKSSERPVLTVSPKSVDISFATNIEFYLRRPSGNLTYIFAIKTKLDVQLHLIPADIQDKGRLTAAINQTSLSVGILNSEIGAINLNLLNTLMDTIVSLYIRPQLNKLGACGFPLPMWGKQAHYQNIQLTPAQNAIIIGVDVKCAKDEMGRIPDHPFVRNEQWKKTQGMFFQVVDESNGRQPIKL